MLKLGLASIFDGMSLALTGQPINWVSQLLDITNVISVILGAIILWKGGTFMYEKLYAEPEKNGNMNITTIDMGKIAGILLLLLFAFTPLLGSAIEGLINWAISN